MTYKSISVYNAIKENPNYNLDEYKEEKSNKEFVQNIRLI